MKACVVAFLAAALALVPGCGQSAPVAPPAQQARVATMADCVDALTDAAAKNDADYFRALMPKGTDDAGVAAMIMQVNSSGMRDNYRERLTDAVSDSARLNYHDDQRRCSFQVYLMHDDGGWRVRRIGFCR